MFKDTRIHCSLILCLIFLGTTLSGLSARYVEVTRRAANIRVEPTTSAGLVATARQGDIFVLVREEGNWYQIQMFSGNTRYIYKNLVDRIYELPETPGDIELRRQVALAWFEAERKAEEESARRYDPESRPDRYFSYKDLLSDRYKLETMHEFDINPVLYRPILIEGYQQNWF